MYAPAESRHEHVPPPAGGPAGASGPPAARVSEADLEVVRDVWKKSGYRGVYRRGDRPGGRLVYRAYPYAKRRNGHVGQYPSAREAAAAIVRWWRARHGPGWAAAYRARVCPPWCPLRGPGGRYRVVVWTRGVAADLCDGAGATRWFGSKAAAGAAYRAWRDAAYGAGWPDVLWRAAVKG